MVFIIAGFTAVIISSVSNSSMCVLIIIICVSVSAYIYTYIYIYIYIYVYMMEHINERINFKYEDCRLK